MITGQSLNPISSHSTGFRNQAASGLSIRQLRINVNFFYQSLPRIVDEFSFNVEYIDFFGSFLVYVIIIIIQLCVQIMERHDKRVYLDINYVFGSNSSLNLRNSLSFLEEDQKLKLVYTAGKSIVKKDIDSDQMEFIRLSDNIQSIQCMAISPTRNHAAICEKIKNQNFILLNLYGLKNRDSEIKHFKLPQSQKQSTFKIIAFAPSQPKYACCLTGQPEFQLIFLDISRSRGLAVSNFPVKNANSLAISPTQSHLVSVCGLNFFRLYKVEDYSFKISEDIKKLPKSRNFTVQSWFDKTKILIGTDRGELFMVGPVGTNYQVKKIYANVFNESNLQLSVLEIGILSKGFILGSNQGNFSLWIKKQENQENFEDQYAGQMVRTWKVPENRMSQMSSIAICPKQENIAVSFKNNSIALMKMCKLMSQGDEIIPDEDLFDYIHQGFHDGPISMMDTCMHRPIIATLSKPERTIRIWNYKKPNCELTKKFDPKLDGIDESNTGEMLTTMALHPFGYYLATGFCDKMRIYHILESELRNYKQIVLRGVCQLKFSNGGHMLAAAYSKQKYNIHLINVYNAYTLEEIARLSDHSNVITELFWKPDDRALYSVGADGFIVEWKCDFRSDSKEWGCRKWSQPSGKYTSGIFQKTSKTILVAGQESGKNVVREYKLQKQQAQKIFTMGFRISKLQWLNSQWNIPAIISGTTQGAIKIFNSPFDNIVEQTINIHLKQITKIHVSPCGRYVFSVGEDNNIFIFQVSLTNRQGFISKRLHDQVNEYQLNPLVGVVDDELADIILIQRNHVNEKIRYIKMLEKSLDDMKNKIIMQDEDSSKKYKYKLTKLENQLNLVITDLNNKFQAYKKQKKELELKTQTKFIDTQGQRHKMLQQVQALYEQKLTLQNKKYFQLQNQFDSIHLKNSQQITNTENNIKQSLQTLKQQFVSTFRRAQKVHLSKQQEIVDNQKAFNQKINQIEQQHEEELKKINKKINEIINQKDKKTAQSLTEIENYNREIKLLKEETIDYMSTSDRLNKYLNDCKKELNEILGQMRDKGEQLKQKQENLKMRQQKIGVYQQRIGDLQKKKQILSYRTWQMRQQVQPKQQQIQFLKQQLYCLENQFQNLLKDEKVMKDTQQSILKQKQKCNKKIRQLKAIHKDKQIQIRKICDEIHEIVESKSNDRKFYEDRLNLLYKNNAGLMTNSTRINQNTKGTEQMVRHMNHLKNQITQVNDKGFQGLSKRDAELRKAMIENKNLIEELGRLRQLRENLGKQIKQSNKTSENIKRHINQIKNALSKTSSPLKNISKKPSMREITQLPSLNPAMIRSSSGPISNKRGKIMKGKNFDGDKQLFMSKTKIAELSEKSQMMKIQLRQRQMNFQMFKSIIGQHCQQQNCNDPCFDRILDQYEL